MISKFNEIVCKFKDLCKSTKSFSKKHNFAFTVAELLITIAVLGVMVFFLLGVSIKHSQSEYDAKIDQVDANLSGIVNVALIQNTGKESYSPEEIRRDLIIGQNNLNIKDNVCADNNCWGNNNITDDNGNSVEDLANSPKILLNNNSSIAFGPDNIYIDANGSKGPNKLGKDIKRWNGSYSRPAPADVRIAGVGKYCKAGTVSHYGKCCPQITNTATKKYDGQSCNQICKTNEENGTYKNETEKPRDRWNETVAIMSNNCVYKYTCKSDHSRSGTCCSTTNTSNPSNSSWNKSDCGWTCNSGYNKNGNICCTPNPANSSYIAGNCGWTCNTGYTSTGTSCCKRGTLPANAQWGTGASTCNWTCKTGYTSTGSSCCQRGTLPANAQWGTGANACKWTCKSGYEQYGNSCTRINCSKYNTNLYNAGNSGDIPAGCSCMIHQGSKRNSGGYNGSYTVNGSRYNVNGYCGTPSNNCSEKWFAGPATVVKNSNGNNTGDAYPAMIRDGGGNGKQGLLVIDDCYNNQ